MKKIVIIILVLITHSAIGQSVKPSIVDGPIDKYPVTIRLINRTGYKIDTLIFYNILFPSLAKNDSTEFFLIANYVNGDIVDGRIAGFTIDNVNWVWHCLGRPYDYQNKILRLEILMEPSRYIEGNYRLITKIIV